MEEGEGTYFRVTTTWKNLENPGKLPRKPDNSGKVEIFPQKLETGWTRKDVDPGKPGKWRI